MTNFAVMIEKMNALRKDGYSIHLDDFGTGYSSMLYLKELPIDTIKIDKEFTKYISIDKYSRAIIHNLSSLAKTLGLDVICEGVEDEKQVQFLAKNDCNIIQGYIISKAVPLEQALVLLQEYNIDKTKIVNPDKDTKKK